MTQGNVHTNNVTEAQVAILKAVTPHIIAMAPEERQRLIIGNPNLPSASASWLKSGWLPIIKALVVDRSSPIDAEFTGSLSVVEQDERSLALTEIDCSKLRFKSGFAKNEEPITGEERLKRLKEMPEIRLDAKIGMTLYKEKGQTTLRFIREYLNVLWFEMPGTVLRDSGGYLALLYLYNDYHFSWECGLRRLNEIRYPDYLAALLAG